MTAAEHFDFVSEEDYLAGELVSEVKHEYFAGVAYAMAGGTNRHRDIATNCTGLLHAALRGKKCRASNSDAKVRVQFVTGNRYYYPDAMIVCHPNAPDDTYEESPAVIFEVLSPSTWRIDTGERREAYLTLASLDVYVILDQDAPIATIYRRNEQGGFEKETLEGLADAIDLPTVGVSLPLADVYERVEFDQQRT